MTSTVRTNCTTDELLLVCFVLFTPALNHVKQNLSPYQNSFPLTRSVYMRAGAWEAWAALSPVSNRAGRGRPLASHAHHLQWHLRLPRCAPFFAPVMPSPLLPANDSAAPTCSCPAPERLPGQPRVGARRDRRSADTSAPSDWAGLLFDGHARRLLALPKALLSRVRVGPFVGAEHRLCASWPGTSIPGFVLPHCEIAKVLPLRPTRFSR